MAKCRCNICKSRREPTAIVTTEDRFHKEAREYKVEGGGILPAGTELLVRLLYDFGRAFTDVGPLAFNLLESFVQNNPRWKAYLKDGYDFAVGEIFLQYLDLIPGMRRVSTHIVPDYYPAAGRDEAERLKNAKASLKKWIRWYTDRTHRVVEPDRGWQSVLDAVGPAWVTKDGKFTTRLTAELFKLGLKLSKDQLETVANSLNDYILKDGQYSFTFDQEYVQGSAADYCHRDSCWWGGYEHARPVLKANNGYAIRMWDGGKPVARCWIAPADGGYVLFNAYGKLDLGMFSQVLAMNWGMQFRKCSLEYPNTLYINNGVGFHLHAESPKDHLELNWTRKTDKPYVHPANPCQVCGESAPDDLSVCSICTTRDMTSAEVLETAGMQNVQPAVRLNPSELMISRATAEMIMRYSTNYGVSTVTTQPIFLAGVAQ